MTGRGLGNFLFANGAFHGALDHCLVEKMTAALVRLAVRVYPRRWKDPLPTPAGRGSLVFASQRIWQFDETGALLQISGVQTFYPEEVVFDRLDEFAR